MKLKNRNIKYPRLEFKTGELLLILPHGKEPAELTEKYSGWIKDKELFIKSALLESKKKKLHNRELNELKKLVFDLIEIYSDELGVSSERVAFRNITSKWASCSKYGNLVFNTDMKYLPSRLISYIVFHEMVHMISRKHNAKFWEVINTKYENHKELERELFVYWFRIKSDYKK
ncbi:MAG: DUF45 domain-containing protein [Bacteroidetes bacterium]|nr:DUF45 domain-containing protein [Bacteroidota bacterium]